MGWYEKFESKNKKHEKDRYDIYEPEFETPFKHSDKNSNIISKYIVEFTKFCSLMKFYPDIF